MRELELSDVKKPKTKIKPKSKDVVKPKRKVAEPEEAIKKKKKPAKKESEKGVKPKVPKKVKRTKKGLKNLESAELIAIGEEQVERLQSSAFDSSREQIDQYIRMFSKLRRISKIAEKQYFTKKQGKDIYALMKVYDQLREVIADMRALQDVSEYVESINFEVLQPYVQQTAQSLIDLIRSITQFAEGRLSEEDAQALIVYIKKKGKATGVNLNDAYRNAVDNTRNILAG